MKFFFSSKSTVLLWFLWLVACGDTPKKVVEAEKDIVPEKEISYGPIVVGANKLDQYFLLLSNTRVGIVANQTSVIFKDTTHQNYTHLVDSLVSLNVDVKKVFAPEHGFRGQADAGEKIKDEKDAKTGLPIISLHGKTRKPTPAQLEGIDLIIFDIQDVGVRFYTYIATLQLVMQACAENDIRILVLDRPNPNGHFIDGPTMETENQSFLGMTNIPLVYGMTIGEYAIMINKEGWLGDGKKAKLTIVPMQNYHHEANYILPIRPSPNLPNNTSIYLYPSLGLFEGTNINAGRGTEFQFQRYGASFLNKDKYKFSYTPMPNFGSKNPKEKGKICYGVDLAKSGKMNEVNLKWLIDAYENATDKNLVFNKDGFTKHAGTEKLQEQIVNGTSVEDIKKSWQADIEAFKKIRAKYLIYD